MHSTQYTVVVLRRRKKKKSYRDGVVRNGMTSLPWLHAVLLIDGFQFLFVEKPLFNLSCLRLPVWKWMVSLFLQRTDPSQQRGARVSAKWVLLFSRAPLVLVPLACFAPSCFAEDRQLELATGWRAMRTPHEKDGPRRRGCNAQLHRGCVRALCSHSREAVVCLA